MSLPDLPKFAESLYIGDEVLDTDLEGPGRRCAVWVAGCRIRCEGCCNPHFFERDPKQANDPEEYALTLLERISSDIEGISILGGEPLDQPQALEAFLKTLARHSSLNVMVYSGYSLAHIQNCPEKQGVLEFVDILVDGPYVHKLKETTRRFVGSSNQRIHFLSTRIRADHPDFQKPNYAEFRLGKEGLSVLGFPVCLDDEA